MSEKIKGIIGSRTRAGEVLKWLKSQGGDVDCSICDGSSEEIIYYVNNNEITTINKRHSILFDIVELPRWRAEKGERYFFVSTGDGISASSSCEELDEVDYERFESGNYFKTREEAEAVAEKIREIFKAKL